MHTNRNEELVFQQYCFYILTLNYLRVTTLLKIDQLTEALKSPKNAFSAILGQTVYHHLNIPHKAINSGKLVQQKDKHKHKEPAVYHLKIPHTEKAMILASWSNKNTKTKTKTMTMTQR